MSILPAAVPAKSAFLAKQRYGSSLADGAPDFVLRQESVVQAYLGTINPVNVAD